jgi:chromosome segregation ATPase
MTFDDWIASQTDTKTDIVRPYQLRIEDLEQERARQIETEAGMKRQLDAAWQEIAVLKGQLATLRELREFDATKLAATQARVAELEQALEHMTAAADIGEQQLAAAQAQLERARDWFEVQAKVVSKGSRSSWDLMILRDERDAIDEVLKQVEESK